jgi:homoserine O-acetyltransferase/O-succinyltransferase
VTSNPKYVPRGPASGKAIFYDPEHSQLFTLGEDFVLQSGQRLPQPQLVYETYGALNAAHDNAVLICHAFTGSAHAASHGPGNGPGWWEAMFGPGQAFDPDVDFIICANVLGGCYGSTGPLSPDPHTGKAYGARFPVITIGDMVDAQLRLVQSLGIERLRAVVGGSMGGMQALLWPLRYPDRVAAAIPIAAADRLSPDGIAYHAVGRAAIMNDPGWLGGDYDPQDPPRAGVAIARQLAHITYLNHEAMERKFGRLRPGGADVGFTWNAEFEVEHYLAHQGEAFATRFDPNCYLYLSRAMDYFDMGENEPLEEVFERIRARVFAINYLTDGLFPIEDARRTVRALKRAGVDTTSVELPSPNGHDTFLIETEVISPMIRAFIDHTPF